MEYDQQSSDSPPGTPPLKAKNHNHCFTSCFRRPAAGDGDQVESPHGARPLIRSPTSWRRQKAHEKCLGLCCGGRHRRRLITDFGYDPLSYALNFDEGSETESPTSAQQLRLRCFSSRLPASPQRDGGGGGGFDDPKRAHGVDGMNEPLRFS